MNKARNASNTPAEIFEGHRAYLLGLAYRMIGSLMEAEDIVQEAYLRFQKAAADAKIDNPRAYLTTITTRLCLDFLKSARAQREEYVGPWLPEPLLTADAPSELVLRRESISMAFLTLLERLSPVERAVYLLREIFDCGYGEISAVVEKSEANCRQLFSRARKSLSHRRKRYPMDEERQRYLISAFLAAIEREDMEVLTSVLAEDVRWQTDGGGQVTAATRPLEGRDRVIKFALGIAPKRPESLRIEFVEANGTQSILLKVDGRTFGIWQFDIEDERIAEIWAVVNPDKLKHLQHL